ncbi:MAG: dihydrodipicolinate synthase family protein [Patescibacteria group bacterium]
MNPKKYAGAWTALITPFKKDGSLDEAALRKLVRMQIEGGITGIVPVGTTGESPTTTADEDRRIIEITVEESAGRVPVMAGTGSNNTHEAILYTERQRKREPTHVSSSRRTTTNRRPTA